MAERDKITVVIPANNEELCLADCLTSVHASELSSHPAIIKEVVIAANGCTDRTVEIAEGFRAAFETDGWRYEIAVLADGSKPRALNVACASTSGTTIWLYLDADIVVSPKMLDALISELRHKEARFAAGRLRIARSDYWTTRRYADVWSRLPFFRQGATGAGLFAVNAAGRMRWGDFPNIISDDTFVRLHFALHERVEVDAEYEWPMVDGFTNLVRVRRRQDAGVAEVRRMFPELARNEGVPPLRAGDAARIAWEAPLGCAIYIAVAILARLGRLVDCDAGQRWSRGRRRTRRAARESP